MTIRRGLCAVAALLLMAAPVRAQIMPPGTQTIGVVSTGTTDCVSNSNCAKWSLTTQIASLTVQLTGTMTSMTVTFETTSDGATWVATSAVNLGTMAFATTATAVGQYAILNNGVQGVRVRCTTYVSGAINATAVRGYASSAFRLFDLSLVTGTLAANHGGTGIASYAVGDMLYASAATTLSKLADVAAGSYLRAGGVTTAPLWSTLVLPNSATQGDLMTATSANTVGSVAAVAAGSVLASAGTSTVPAYTATPSITSITVKAGSGTGPLKPGGQLCSTIAGTCSCSAFADSATLNTWNVVTCSVPASTLAANGDRLVTKFAMKAAASTDTKEIQIWWNGGTCTGTGANACSTGTKLNDNASGSTGVEFQSNDTVWRLASGSQKLEDVSITATSIGNHSTTTASVTDTNAIPFVVAYRNTTSSAATYQGTPVFTIDYAAGQ